MSTSVVPVFQIVGYKNTGKTHLVSRLVSCYKAAGLRVAVIKHDDHGFEMDHKGTDTYQIRSAGAAAVAITSPSRTAIVEEQGLSLNELIERFATYDLVLVEGFKKESYPKLVIVRHADDLELPEQLSNVQGVVVWPSINESVDLEGYAASDLKFDINDTEKIAAFIKSDCSL